MGGYHRRGLRRRRHWLLIALMAVVVVAAGTLVAVRILTGCTTADVVVAVDRVVADPVRQVLQSDEGRVECARFRVVDAAETLASDIRADLPGLPAVWIPATSLALDGLDAQPGAVVPSAPLASSPTVLVVPEGERDRYGDPAQPVSWTALLTHPQPPALPDPNVERGSLAALTALRAVIGDDAGKPRPAFVAAVLALSQGDLKSTGAGYADIDRLGVTARAFLTSEQSAVQQNRGRGVTVVPVPLRDAGVALDVPFVRVGGDHPPEVDRAVDALERQLRGPVGREAFGAAGLRAPDGRRLPGGDANEEGWLSTPPSPTPLPSRQVAVETLRLWSSLTLKSRLLAVIDVSGSMAAPAGGTNRITLAAGAAQAGLALFPDASAVGLWTFSSRPPPETPWQELVPLRTLTDPVRGAPSQRAALAAAATTLPARLGGNTALYETALAAVRAVRTGFEADRTNTVVLFTDGRNDIEGGIDLPVLLQTLRAENDPARPVELITIALGPDADAEALRQMSEATGGRSYVAQNPEDIRAVFLDALSERSCKPTCS